MRFRRPDKRVKSKWSDWAVWYGPEGEAGDCATEVKKYLEGEYIVSEYQDITWLFNENPDNPNNDYDNPILKTSVWVKARGPREAAAIGVEKLGYYGGGEEMVSELPK